MDDAGEGSGGPTPTPPQPGSRRSVASLEGDYAASSAGTAGEAVPERLPPGAYLRGGRDAKEAAKAKAAASSPGSISGAGGEEGSRPGAYSVEGPDGAAAAAAASSAAPTAAAAREPLGESLVEVTHAILVEDVPPHPLRAEAGYPDGGAEAPAVLLDAEVVPAEEAKVGGTGGEPGFSLRSRRVQLCLAVVVVAILGLAFGLGMSLGRGGGKATQATGAGAGAGAGAGVAATPPAPSAEQTGEEACEERGYGIQECLSVGCCEWDDGECFSAVEDSPCRPPAGGQGEARPAGPGTVLPPTPVPVADLAILPNGEEACEERGYGIQECLSVGCCQWDDGECFSAVGEGQCISEGGEAACEGRDLDQRQCFSIGCCKWDENRGCSSAVGSGPCARQSGEEACESHGYGRTTCLTVGCCEWDGGECFSAVEDGPCAAAPAGAEAERTRPNGLDFSFSLSYSMTFSFDLSYLGSASYDWGSLSFYSQSVQERRRGRRRLDRGGARRNRKKHSMEFVEKASRSLRSIPLDDGPVPSLPEDR